MNLNHKQSDLSDPLLIYRPTPEPQSSVTQSAEHIIQQNHSSDWIWQTVFPGGNEVYFTAPACGEVEESWEW